VHGGRPARALPRLAVGLGWPLADSGPPHHKRAVMSFLEELKWRGLLYQTTGAEELQKHLATPGRAAYAGFDPTADALHVGHFIPIKLLMQFQRSGHRPIALVGGGTGLIGDPSGKDAERTLLDRERVEANVAGIRGVLERFLDFSSGKT